jgi:alcohol dehydrogenase class IV
MNAYRFFMPTQVLFGNGKSKEIPQIIAGFGDRCLIVSRPRRGTLAGLYDSIESLLNAQGIQTEFFDQVVPNPTLEGVEHGIIKAADFDANVVLGIGGGSVLDTAKLIGLLYRKDKVLDWESALSTYDHPFRVEDAPASALPIVTLTTTSGTGSHCTQAAVVTDTNNTSKVTLFHKHLFPSVSIVDPELMHSVPARVTAATGFDTFTHAFESYLGERTSPLTEHMSFEAISRVLEFVPRAMENPADSEAREALAWADTLAGMCLANGGADLPHPLGEIIGGICPRIAHGETLAMVYPAFLNFKAQSAPDKFIGLARHLGLAPEPEALVNRLLEFLEETELSKATEWAQLTVEEKDAIEDHPLLGQLMPDQSSTLKKMMHQSITTP